METPRAQQPFYECPRYQHCAAPVCPLDVQMLDRGGSHPAEAGCGARRATRLAITARHPNGSALPTGGLTQREIGNDKRGASSKKRWDAMSPEDRAAKLAKLVPFAPKHVGITPQHGF